MTPEPPPQLMIYREATARDLPLPEYATEGAAGVDLRAAVDASAPVIIEPGKWKLIPTGLRIALPPGYEAQIRPRSGLALKHGIGLLNSPGTIDEDYRGEIGIIMFNFGDEPFTIRKGERIAQMVFARAIRLEFFEVEQGDQLTTTERGEGGFGHTGK